MERLTGIRFRNEIRGLLRERAVRGFVRFSDQEGLLASDAPRWKGSLQDLQEDLAQRGYLQVLQGELLRVTPGPELLFERCREIPPTPPALEENSPQRLFLAARFLRFPAQMPDRDGVELCCLAMKARQDEGRWLGRLREQAALLQRSRSTSGFALAGLLLLEEDQDSCFSPSMRVQ